MEIELRSESMYQTLCSPASVQRSRCGPENMISKCNNTAIVCQATCTLLVTMSGDEYFPSIKCGCNCEPQAARISDDGCEDDWSRCDCIQCGGGRCNVLVHLTAKVAWIVFKLGHEPETPDEIDAAPRYCGSCIDHHHRKLEQDAVRRKRTQRDTHESCSCPAEEHVRTCTKTSRKY